MDSSGGVVPGAEVLLTGGASERHTVTDQTGHFVFGGVPAGSITVTVSADRFAPVTVDVPADRAELHVVLQPAVLSEVVEVQAITGRIRTATKTDTPLRDVPQAITVVSKQTMAALNMTNMADVVRYVPGIGYAQGEGNRDTPVFRGNGSTSDFYVDGVRDDVQYYRDVYNLDRIEALKGPNAMIFGRGGAGGVINRVQRVAGWTPSREASLQAGSYDNRRVTTDINQPLTSSVAVRLSAMYENTNSYRSQVGLERYGVNPTLSIGLGAGTIARVGYEHFHDNRTADRGIPSFQGRPLPTDAATFFGNPDASVADVTVNAMFAFVEHRFDDRSTLRNRTSFGHYDKFYQNVFPGAVNAAGNSVSISGYNNGTERRNLFNQTDLTLQRRTGRFEHTLLAGMELGRQVTDNLRSTAYFPTLGATTTSISLPVTAPVTTAPLEFRQSATDARNHGTATTVAVYAQDQIALTQHVQAVVGVRLDDFGVDFQNLRSNAELTSHDRRLSPRLGVVLKPVVPLSVYGSYSLTFQPRAGDQMSSLSLTNQALAPEKFTNYEVGAKWEFAVNASVTAAVYDLERGNVVITDPTNPAVSLLVDGQRTRGVEIGVSGDLTRRWNVMGAYAYQDGAITRSLSVTAPAGAMLANLPKQSLSVWNRYDLTQRLSGGLGLIYRSDIFTSTDNTVVLPGSFRVDAAAYWTLNARLAAQLNLENVFNERYYAFANGNNNITPGSPRAVRVGLTTRF